MSEQKIPIPAMLYNAAVGGHVTNSQQIIDENENKEQSQINAEVKQNLGQGGSVDDRIATAKSEIKGGATSACNTLGKAEGLISAENTRAQAAEEQLRTLYNNLQQSQPIPVTSLPATGEAGKIYRLAGTTSYADYMYSESDLTTPIKMAEYNNAIDDEPTAGSDNLVKSGGVNNTISSLEIKDIYTNYIPQNTFVSMPKSCFRYGSLQGAGTGAPSSAQECAYSNFIKVIPGSKLTFSINRTLSKYVKIRVQARNIDDYKRTTDWNLIYTGYDIPSNSITVPEWANYISVGFSVYNSSDNTQYDDALANYTEDLLSLKSDIAFSLSNIRYFDYSHNNYLVGDNTNMVHQKLTGFAVGHDYKFCLTNPNFDISGDTITTQHSRLEINIVYTDGYKVTPVLVSAFNDILKSCYNFQIEKIEGKIFSHVEVWIRATKGERVDFCIYDVTIDKFVLTNCLIGDNTNIQQTSYIKLIRGRKYQIVLNDTSFARNNAKPNNNATLFGIESYNSLSEKTTLVNVVFGTGYGTLDKFYTFIVPNDSDYVSVIGRANKDVEILFSIEDITLTEIITYNISIPWDSASRGNKVLKDDGTLSTNLNNGFFSDKIEIPNGVKSVQFKNVYIETSIWDITCPIVAFNSSDVVIGYIYFESKNRKYDLTYQLPNNTSYIKVSSGAYPNRYGNLPTLYFVSNGDNLLEDIANEHSNYPLSKEVDNLVNQLARAPRYSSVSQANTQFLISFFSDIHYDIQNLLRYISFNKKHNKKIDLQLCGGDMVDYYWSFINYSFNRWINTEGTSNIILTLGNHDTGESSFVFPSSNKVDVYNRIYSQLISNWDVTQPQNAATEGLMYFYKDYTTKGIRLIVLDCMYWTDAENIWLKNVLADAKTQSLSVIISTHYQPDVINAFNCKGFSSLQKNNPSDFLNNAAAASVHDFINDGGDFICWLAGHTHKDYVGTLVTYPEQICIVITCASSNDEQCAYCDSERVVNTVSQDAFDVIAIDKYNKVIKILRVGDNMDSWMRSRKTLTIDYINKTVINVE